MESDPSQTSQPGQPLSCYGQSSCSHSDMLSFKLSPEAELAVLMMTDRLWVDVLQHGVVSAQCLVNLQGTIVVIDVSLLGGQ